jgi:hypothetical protein
LPPVFFHLWNGSADDTWPPEHPEPWLLAARFGEGTFADRFTCTARGRDLSTA